MQADPLFEQNKPLAESGNVEAQSFLGHCYQEGIGVAKDMVEAVKWIRKAADQDDAEEILRQGVFQRGERPGFFELGLLAEATAVIHAVNGRPVAAQRGQVVSSLLASRDGLCGRQI